MKEKNCFNITIAGKSYTLSGQESSDYLKSIADYIESKYETFCENTNFRSFPMDMQHVMLQVNVADDYFKAKEELAIQKRKLAEKTLEMEELKKSFVAMQVRYENLEAGAKLTQKKYQEAKARIAYLENSQKNDMF